MRFLYGNGLGINLKFLELLVRNTIINQPSLDDLDSIPDTATAAPTVTAPSATRSPRGSSSAAASETTRTTSQRAQGTLTPSTERPVDERSRKTGERAAVMKKLGAVTL